MNGMTPGLITPEQTRRFLMTMWIAMVATLPVYYFITTVTTSNQPDPNSPLVVPLLVVAVLIVLMSFYVKARFGAREGRARTLAFVRAGYIMALVLTEVPAVLGIIVHFLTGWPKTWVFFLISAAGYLLNFPKREDFESLGGSA